MELAVVNPVGIFGPVLGPTARLDRDGLRPARRLDGRRHAALAFAVVDVRDAADLHLRAMIDPAAAGERFIAAAGDGVWLADIAASCASSSAMPPHRCPRPSSRTTSCAASQPGARTDGPRGRSPAPSQRGEGATRPRLATTLPGGDRPRHRREPASAPTTMRCCRQREHPDPVRRSRGAAVGRGPTARAGARPVRIAVRAAGVGPTDLKIRRGDLQSVFALPEPAVLGFEAAGVVDALGADTHGVSIGDEVAAWLPGLGGYGEYALASAWTGNPAVVELGGRGRPSRQRRGRGRRPAPARRPGGRDAARARRRRGGRDDRHPARSASTLPSSPPSGPTTTQR